jgi:hypothetical protein
MFLVKWAGLGYEHCTWETQEDINDDAIIAEFRRLEGVTPEEPELSGQDVNRIIDSAVTVSAENAGGNPDIALLRSQLYAQTRSFQFTKFGVDIPELLMAECGPKSHSSKTNQDEVRSCLNEMVYKVSIDNKSDLSTSNHCTSLPPPLFAEYDVVLPVTSKGLLLNVGESNGVVQFLGYRQLNGGKGPAELANLVRATGDLIIAVNGKSTVGKSFTEVIGMLKDNITYAYIRFLSSNLKNADTTSCGKFGKYLYDYTTKQYKSDRRRLLAKRALASEAEGDDSSTSSEEAPDSDNDSDGSSASDLDVDSEDEDLMMEKRRGKPVADDSDSEASGDDGEEKKSSDIEKTPESKSELTNPEAKTFTQKQQSTRCLAFELLDLDVGYSSDEGGDEDNAYFVSRQLYCCFHFNFLDAVLIVSYSISVRWS